MCLVKLVRTIVQCKDLRDWFLKYRALYPSFFNISVINHYSPNILVVGHPLPNSSQSQEVKSHICCHHLACMNHFIKKKSSANIHTVCCDSNKCISTFPDLWQKKKTTTLSTKMDSERYGVLQDISKKCKKVNGCPFHMVRTSIIVFDEIEIDYHSTHCFSFILSGSNWYRV